MCVCQVALAPERQEGSRQDLVCTAVEAKDERYRFTHAHAHTHKHAHTHRGCSLRPSGCLLYLRMLSDHPVVVDSGSLVCLRGGSIVH